MLIAFYLACAVAGLVAWFAYVRPKLAAYQRTAGVIKELNAREQTLGSWLWLKLKGLKTAICLAAVSLFTTLHDDVLHLLGLDPSALAPFQNSSTWHLIVSDGIALKAAGIATFASMLLVFHKAVKDVQTVPQAQPVIVPPGGTAAAGGK